MTDQKTIRIHAVISVKELSDKLELPVTKVIGLLLKNGIMATINESLDFETAAIISAEFDVRAELDSTSSVAATVGDSHALIPRAPVVTIMGHVDHGKTTLLDTLREANVAAGESGGITQHIDAYQVTLESKSQHHINTITFLDTPGHAAFTAMRQHGASITDIVVLVVAANDGIKAQTIEAIDHAKRAHVPVIVAVTKIDLPGANVERIKQQLAELDMVPEEWGGKTVIVPVSAKTKQGLPELLDMILLVSDIQNLQATVEGSAVGVVVESHLEPGKGAVATVLIQNGVLKVGQPIAVGATYGKVRTLESFLRRKIEQAGPSDPVVISGLQIVPNFGDHLIGCMSDKEAKEQATKFAQNVAHTKVHRLHATGLDESVSDDLVQQHELPLVIKTDVKGSLEAIHKVLEELHTDEVTVTITSEGVGPVSESDITHAKATKARVLSFRAPIHSAIRSLASKENVPLFTYDVIYDLTEDVKKALSKLLPPEIVEVPLGQAKIIALFKGDKRTLVVGVQVEEGTITQDSSFHLMRKKELAADGTILAIRRGKEVIAEAGSGQQAGLSIPGTIGAHEGDMIHTFRTETRYRSL